ncbi:MAG: hypothetical protein B6U85_04415 [Desulfurococcales archaeon ex4484_42]|nr:MAG: hypothetical protein B6U85_04415 [Desulfurococcales archaeon ex4484_42]
MYRVFRVGISLSMEVTSQDIQDLTLRLHSILTKIGIHAYVDRSLQSIIALENEVSIAFFISHTGRAVLNIQIDCLRDEECIAELNNLISLSNLIVKELKLITINNVEYIVKRELILENVMEIDIEGIDRELKYRGLLRVSLSEKNVNLGLDTSKLLIYKYKYIDNRLNPILIDIIYLLGRSSMNVAVITCLTLTKLPIINEYLVELITLSDLVLTIVRNGLR